MTNVSRFEVSISDFDNVLGFRRHFFLLISFRWNKIFMYKNIFWKALWPISNTATLLLWPAGNSILVVGRGFHCLSSNLPTSNLITLLHCVGGSYGPYGGGICPQGGRSSQNLNFQNFKNFLDWSLLGWEPCSACGRTPLPPWPSLPWPPFTSMRPPCPTKAWGPACPASAGSTFPVLARARHQLRPHRRSLHDWGRTEAAAATRQQQSWGRTHATGGRSATTQGLVGILHRVW